MTVTREQVNVAKRLGWRAPRIDEGQSHACLGGCGNCRVLAPEDADAGWCCDECTRGIVGAIADAEAIAAAHGVTIERLQQVGPRARCKLPRLSLTGNRLEDEAAARAVLVNDTAHRLRRHVAGTTAEGVEAAILDGSLVLPDGLTPTDTNVAAVRAWHNGRNP